MSIFYDKKSSVIKKLENEFLKTKSSFIKIAIAILLLGIGLIIGISISPQNNEQKDILIKELRTKLQEKNSKLQIDSTYSAGIKSLLSKKDRDRHNMYALNYARQVRGLDAQIASEWIKKFIDEWNSLLDHPATGDIFKRRSYTLTRFVIAMSKNLHPQDFVTWQAEFFGGKWLGELHFDIDKDKLPTSRFTQAHPHEFTHRSACDIAMVFNQLLTNAQVLFMPEIQCNSPQSMISFYLSGKTYNKTLTLFIKKLRSKNFIVVEKTRKGIRQILLNTPRSF